MCELFVARAERPFRLAELWAFAERLERFGVAGFGWGAAWLVADGRLDTYRDVRAFHDDPGRGDVGRTLTRSALVHLRRPSRLSTLTLADTQPFLDRAGRFAFSHNGDFRDVRGLRARYRGEGRIQGRADSEVGLRRLEDDWPGGDPSAALAALHAALGGQANLAVLAADGTAYLYAGNSENPVFTFGLADVRIASTGVYSLDRSLFRLVAPEATSRGLVRLGHTATL